ncbi:MAG: hypothetical protein IPM32_10365 [Ignavibacteriae bacterium]|nr:hypothetical protein [Ignavibacteriota bacterium]
MNKNLQFIRYVENEFSEIEKKKFETELLKDENLKLEFNKFLKRYKSLNPGINFNEEYFINLLPKVRERISAKEKSFLNFNKIPKTAFVIPIIIIALVILFSVFNNQSKIEEKINFENLVSEFIENNEIANELLSESFELNRSSSYDPNIYSYIYDESDYENIIINYIDENNLTFELNENVINQLSEDEYNLVYGELINKKIL